VYIDEDIYIYIARLAAATRKNSLIRLGVSPRGSIALARMSQACAWLSGRDYVIPSDIQFVFFDVFEHRLVLDSQARISNTTARGLLTDIVKTVSPPDITRTRSDL
jgi:MoxR-like ATPase